MRLALRSASERLAAQDGKGIWVNWVWGITLCLYAVGAVMIPLMEVDATQYAAISREMADSGLPWWIVKDRGGDYLDKPPLLFWTAAASFKTFGYNRVAYRLTSLVVGLLALVAVRGLGRAYFNRQAGDWGALLLATTQGMFLMMHDVRTDTLLMGMVAMALWRFARFGQTGRFKHGLEGWLFLGLALITKGPVAAIAVGAAFGPAWLIGRRWNRLFHPVHLAGLGVVGLVLLPMCIGLYEQHGANGLRFFFWTQSFGRITGENVWSNNPDPLFLYHSLLWILLPWPIWCIAAIGWAGKVLGRGRASEGFWVLLPGFALPLISLSLSKYQLPHYAFVVLPCLAALTGGYLADAKSRVRWLDIVNMGIGVGLAVLALLLGASLMGVMPWYLWVPAQALAGMAIWLAFTNKKVFERRMAVPVFGILTANLVLNAWFYPELINRYQAPTAMAKYMLDLTAQGVPVEKWATYRAHHYALEWGVNHYLPDFGNREALAMEIRKGSINHVYVQRKELPAVDSLNLPYKVLLRQVSFPVSRLSPTFLNASTRIAVLEEMVALEFLNADY